MLYLLDIFKSHKMKKIILSATAIIAFAFNGIAQVPDLMFENWGDAAPPFVTIVDYRVSHEPQAISHKS